MYHFATNGEKSDRHQQQTSGIKSTLHFETVNKQISMLTKAIPDNGV